MQNIRFWCQRDVETLRANIRQNLPWYRGENVPLVGEPSGYEEMTKRFDWSCFETLNQRTGESDDAENTVTVHKAFSSLSPQQAADERIWVYATHHGVQQYTAERWKIPEKWDDGRVEKHIVAHYFGGTGNRGLTRDNAISRLWWIGHAAARCEDYAFRETLDIILRDSDVRKNILERSMGMSKEILSGLVRLLGKRLADAKKGAAKDKAVKPPIYHRDNFRPFIRDVHRRGGRIMLNVLDAEHLDRLLDSMAEKALSTNE